ncbi:hypothetical protein BT96DRAFT_1020437 [Gymnopus androsaceus JB14]|uniref:Uncharacterized protein n=1 Tax=Gymnopus androsaceus JB14 TaxID=1447944 RepID=A0A6A4HH38_9AGAR|nr:hypothetical protein BT96DRAFT_1020437 [Gymnopus androsaceus JB14]
MVQLFGLLLIACNLADYAYGFSALPWPNTLLRYVDEKLFSSTNDMNNLVQNCTTRDNTTISAQWLRTAYHDMSTHNVDDGTGGLDASIQYELDRPQRPPTVPEPQQPLESHIEAFRRQGFNQTEMIALVACGHTLGGVRQEDFPLIVTENLGATDVDTFDTTLAFDTTMSLTESPNIFKSPPKMYFVGPNLTARSDFRIFSSDANVTMQSLLSSDKFTQTCGDLIQRMINTVPNGVTLTDPVTEPSNYVVSDPLLSYQNGTFIMIITLRVLNPSASSTVTMLWADRQGSFCPSTGCSCSIIQHRVSHIHPLAQGVTAEQYLFNATINATSSISSFGSKSATCNGSDPVIVDNGGSGFVIEQDSLFVDFKRTKTLIELSPTISESFEVVVAIHVSEAVEATASLSTFAHPNLNTTPPLLPVITSTPLQLDDTDPPEGGFTFFSANISNGVFYLDVTANVGSTTYSVENFDFIDASDLFSAVLL